MDVFYYSTAAEVGEVEHVLDVELEQFAASLQVGFVDVQVLQGAVNSLEETMGHFFDFGGERGDFYFEFI